MTKTAEFPAPFLLRNELALVTGGASGIGFEIARCLAIAGARVVLVGRRRDALCQAAGRIGNLASFEMSDITNLDALPQVMERVVSREGPISILINNAGNHLKKAAVDTSDREFASVFDVHVNAAFALSRLVGKHMLNERHGSIVFIASMASLLGIPMVSAYSASKAAQLGLVRSLASEFSSEGVRVNAIAPGWIDTPMLHAALQNDPKRSAKILSRTPAMRFGSPADIGWAAVYLCSPAACFVTGTVLPVDGGASIGF